MLSFNEFILEHVVNIGHDPKNEHLRDKHRQEIHNILHKSYSGIGGYGGLSSGSPEESKAIHHDISHSVIKAVKRDGKLNSVTLFKKQHGLKAIAVGTDGSLQGKRDWKKTFEDDHTFKRSWGEASGAMEKVHTKAGHTKVPNTQAERLTGKKVTPVPGDDYAYERSIGGHMHKKVIFGHPKD